MPRNTYGMMPADQTPSTTSRPTREKKCKKIFDPADHDQPSRKRKVSDSSAAPGNGQSTLNSTAALSGLGLNRGTSQITVGSKSLTIRTTSATKSNKNISNESNSPSSSNSMRSLAINRENACMYCGLDTPKHKKGRIEHLLKCKDCVNIVHPSCMDYCEELTRKIMSMPWQCNNCKTCFVCKEENDDDCMLICDSCDLGFHMACHSPALETKPSGRWECFRCNAFQASYARGQRPSSRSGQTSESGISSQSSDVSNCSYGAQNSKKITNGSDQYILSHSENRALGPNYTKNGTHSSPSNNDIKPQGKRSSSPNLSLKESSSPSSNKKRFLPILPPHLHPHTGLLPDNWEDYKPDPDIPDVSKWDHHQIKEYFASQGFSTDICKIFVDQEIDGHSLLLLQRTDVVSGLGLKLGPALKIYSHVKKLQTRRNFPDY